MCAGWQNPAELEFVPLWATSVLGESLAARFVTIIQGPVSTCLELTEKGNFMHLYTRSGLWSGSCTQVSVQRNLYGVSCQ